MPKNHPAGPSREELRRLGLESLRRPINARDEDGNPFEYKCTPHPLLLRVKKEFGGGVWGAHEVGCCGSYHNDPQLTVLYDGLEHTIRQGCDDMLWWGVLRPNDRHYVASAHLRLKENVGEVKIHMPRTADITDRRILTVLSLFMPTGYKIMSTPSRTDKFDSHYKITLSKRR